MCKFYSCLLAVLAWAYVNAYTGDSAKSACARDSSCTSLAEESEYRGKNLLQLSHDHKTGEVDEHKDAEVHQHMGFKVYSGSSTATTERPITFITVYDPYFETNLGTSLLWRERSNKPHEWILIDNNHNFGISQMYADAQKAAANDLMVFLHPDIILPADFYMNFMHKLWIIQEHDTNWGVLGVVGVPHGEFRSNSSITDFAGEKSSDDNIADFLSVQGIDECLFVLKKGSPQFDPQLPGFDLYGLDIVLSARKQGQNSYLLNVPVYHKVRGLDGKIFQEELFDAKIDSPEYILRVSGTAEYFSHKWCGSGFLPVMGPAYRVECNAFCKVIDMLNRSHHNETCVDPTGEFPTGHVIR